MTYKSMLLGAAAIAGAIFFTDGMVTPAEAGKKVDCLYRAEDIKGRSIIGEATHKKGSTACMRALNRCHTKVRRAQSRKKFGRIAFKCTRLL
ncbi:MAG: hypothetical protein AB3N20_07770 [Rhizobiaceae bacterium]